MKIDAKVWQKVNKTKIFAAFLFLNFHPKSKLLQKYAFFIQCVSKKKVASLQNYTICQLSENSIIKMTHILNYYFPNLVILQPKSSKV